MKAEQSFERQANCRVKPTAYNDNPASRFEGGVLYFNPCGIS